MPINVDLDMDLTPPSLTTSPAPPQQTTSFNRSPPSPPETCCPSEGSTADYPSPIPLARSHDIPSPYSSIELFAVSPAIQHEPEVLPRLLNVMNNSSWAPSDDMVMGSPSASSSSTVPNIMPTEYDPFSPSYDSCLPAPFGSHHDSYVPAPPQHLLSSHTPPASASSSSNLPSLNSRSVFSSRHDISASRTGIESSTAYAPSYASNQYAAPNGLSTSYPTDGAQYSSNMPPYLAGSSASAWSKPEYDTSQLYMNPQASGSDLRQDRQSSKSSKSKRPSRKHTTKEEANFQCEVKGCGKFFSRSYNYKSHLETHDEKREYPFPCPLDGCTKKFVRKTDLQRHHQSVHMKERNHKCDFCGRLFARKDTLRRHMDDGCSKRFDLGTVDVRGEGFGSLPLGIRPANYDDLPSGPAILPPIQIDSLPPSLRNRGHDSNNVDQHHGLPWQR